MRQGQIEIDIEFLNEQLVDGGAVAQVDPVADGRILLLGLALAIHNVVVALGARDGRRQPDLFVGGLLVYHIGTDVGKGNV